MVLRYSMQKLEYTCNIACINILNKHKIVLHSYNKSHMLCGLTVSMGVTKNALVLLGFRLQYLHGRQQYALIFLGVGVNFAIHTFS